ncbi:MAG: hypothetical protein KBC45_08765 [Pseudomonas sp.]|uniref:hypothetical protein n=1 Tax=Pseudomonas sp. TaxID=306 RepID=UPI001B6263E1|nr:hypothetical protein [Pseudomonas sp.]MBP6954500.1 hypothetical protein [Pseudomonas sp.]
MPEVKRYQFKGAAGEYVYANDFDRVTAERDSLQQRLTAADEKNDTLSTAYVSAGEREHLLRLRVADLEGLLQMFIENTDDKDVIELAQHALKPAEPAKDEHACTGCGSKGWTANCKECVPY